ncbi:pentapeptide repeat-containing protein [Flavobacterium sp.]|uniref:pentapeptide repeat-containing protein n=1 Tax=Flavobacterium sp. TaxID=239 RepID=UPI002612B436|nr:pentapeptide repeat-containing protein [Flavobacterium sp.]
MSYNYIYDQNFTGKVLSQADIQDTEFENCTFIDCDFTTCFFRNVTFVGCNFLHCNFKAAPINHTSFRGVWFTSCNLTSVNFAMTDQVIYEFHFKDCLLDYSQFYKLKLKNIQFIHCSMIAVDFMTTDLSGALFDACNLRRTVFSDTNLEKADFYTSYDYSIDPEKNKIKKARFSLFGLKGLLEKYELNIID